MKLLLDTHALLWFPRSDERLSDELKETIEAAGSDAMVSIASLWEIAIKSSLGKLVLARQFEELFPLSIERSGLGLLDIRVDHIVAL